MFQAKLLKFDAPLSTEEIIVAMQDFRGWWTRADIARKLGCSKSPSLIRVINQAVAEKQLIWTTEKMPNGVDCFYYAQADLNDPDLCAVDDNGRATLLPF